MAATINQTRPDQTYHSAFYSDSFYQANRSNRNHVAAQKIITLLKNYVHFDSVIDIGCGVGQFLRVCAENGVSTIRGVDGTWVKTEMLVIPPECFTSCDLSQPGIKSRVPEHHFDLTISSEVAEHIDPQDADNFMDNLTSFSDVILFSAAIPHQGGTHHVNEQWPSYWEKKFAARGFVPVDCIRPNIWYDSSIRIDYRQNLMIFVKKEAINSYPALKPETGRPVIDAVHFELWEARQASIGHQQGFITNCKKIFWGIVDLVPSFIRAVKRRL